jgi:nucleotidyltransferase substrate binding protein (TIGR01987 family)
MTERHAVREAFNKGLLTDGEGRMEMIISRNKTSHTYNQAVANDIVDKIVGQYIPCAHEFSHHMQPLVGR